MGCVNSTSALDPSSTQAGGKGGKGGSNSNNRKGAASSKPEDAQATLEAAAKIQRLIRRTNSKGKIAFIAKWKIFNELDTIDEAETLMLAKFLNSLVKHAPVQELTSSDFGKSNPMNASQRLTSIENIEVSFVADDAVDGDITDYRIPKGSVSQETARKIYKVYKNGGKLNINAVQTVLKVVYKTLKEQPNVLNINVGSGEKLTVVGDLHGQFSDLVHIMEESGFPSETNKFVFNGDFVDRGDYGVEVLIFIFALYCAFPGCVFLNRGNHEDGAICAVYGFQKECEAKYTKLVYAMICEVFNYIPLCSVINDSVFIIHGGLFHRADISLADISEIKRNEYRAERAATLSSEQDEERALFLKRLQQEALWSDPHTEDTVVLSKRGAGMMFGPTHTLDFLKHNNLSLVIRSHECVPLGFAKPFEGTPAENSLVTLFSASNYSGAENQAAYMVMHGHYVNGSTRVKENSELCYSTYSFTTGGTAQEKTESTSRLLHELIFKKWNAIKLRFVTADVANTGIVSRNTWAQVMRDATGVEMLWVPLIPVCVPKQALKGLDVDYVKFLDAYHVEGGVQLEMQSFYAHRKKIEAVFRFFDVDGNGFISHEEFVNGCAVINEMLPEDQKLTNPHEILKIMDFDGNNEVDLNEFFETFRILTSKNIHLDALVLPADGLSPSAALAPSAEVAASMGHDDSAKNLMAEPDHADLPPPSLEEEQNSDIDRD